MKKDAYSLPLRSTPSGPQIETRTLYVEEWLDSLPYVDFKKTSQLLFEATKATNEQALKPSARLELVQLYNRPYQYYIDSQIKAGSQHTLQSIDTMQEQTQVLKRIAVNLGLACKLSADELLNKKTLWGQSKPPLLNLLLSLNYLTHALIFSFLEYAPAPKNVWREINFIYGFAESLGQENASLLTSKSQVANQSTTIAQAYKRICLSALADPHHLPYGAIWEIYEQLNSWANLVTLNKFSLTDDPSCQFVMKLDSDSSPLPYAKFNTANADDKNRVLDGTNLIKQIQTHQSSLESGSSLDKTVLLSPYFAKLILTHMSRAWGLPAKRINQRKESTGSIDMACGLNAAYYLLNHEQEFHEPASTSDAGIHGEDPTLHRHTDITPRENYRVDKWNLVDQSARGFAVIKNDRPNYIVRVGDLIIISVKSPSKKWAVGVIRWLMIRQGQIYKIGVQILSADPKPVAVRACNGSTQDTRYRRGLLLRDQNNRNSISLITSRGLYISKRDMEVVEEGKVLLYRAIALPESTTGFEQLVLEPIG